MKNKNIILMYSISFLQGMVFYASVSTLYRQSHGINLFQMGIIESVLSIMILVLEIPWGIICDRIGYKKTLLVCNFVYFLSKIVFYRANSFEMFLLERGMLAFVIAGLSGCDTALIYESVPEEESTRVFGLYHAFGTLGIIVSSFMFTLFIQQDINKSALWTIIPYALAFILTLFIEDVAVEKRESTLSIKEIMDSLKSVKNISLFLIAATLLTETTHTLGTFYNQLQYERVHLPISLFGILYMIMNICSLSNASIGKMVQHIKEEKLISILFMIVSLTCLLLMVTTNPLLSIIGIALLQFSEALFYPMMDTILNRNVTIYRATSLSVFSMIMNMGSSVSNIIYGKCAQMHVSVAFFMGFIMCLIGFGSYLLWNQKQRKA